MNATWVDPPPDAARALALAVLIHEGLWDACEQMLADTARRLGPDAAAALDAEAMAILERETGLDEAYADLTAGRP